MEEEAILSRSMKKYKEHHLSAANGNQENERGFSSSSRNYTDRLVKAIPIAYEQAFSFASSMQEDEDSDGKEPELGEETFIGSPTMTGGETFGEWMVVSCKKKPTPVRKSGATDNNGLGRDVRVKVDLNSNPSSSMAPIGHREGKRKTVPTVEKVDPSSITPSMGRRKNGKLVVSQPQIFSFGGIISGPLGDFSKKQVDSDGRRDDD
ncbi:hypothetical protein FCV25MIE_28994 [Fagus crenata]